MAHPRSSRRSLYVTTGLVIAVVASSTGCRRKPDSDTTMVETPGTGMGCGIRGRVVDAAGAPEARAKMVAISVDQRSRLAGFTDATGRFALVSDCQRGYRLAAQGPLDIASAWLWVADGPVDVEVKVPAGGVHLGVNATSPEDAARLRIFTIVPPSVMRPYAPTPEQCTARAGELGKIRDGARDEITRQLAQVASLDGYCGTCPDVREAIDLAGSLKAGRGIAEVWFNAYGRLFACVPGTHPHEAAFEAVLRELHPELAAMVVFGRIVEAEEMFDESSATRLWAKLQTGPLADTDFARNLKDMGESGPLPEQ